MNRKYPHFAIPEIYGDSLSYYELLRKLVEAMNAVIENYDTIPDQIAEAVANLDASQLFSAVLNQLIHSIATDNTKSANAVKVYKKHDLLYATFNETVNLYESLIDFSTGTATELIPGTNIREVNISELFIELRKLIDINKNNIETVTAVANENSSEITTLHSDITSIENKNTEQDNEISTLRTMISSPYNFKGDVASLSALPASGEVNDTYYVQDVKYKVTWTGSAWVQSSLSEADYQTELSELKGDLGNVKSIIMHNKDEYSHCVWSSIKTDETVYLQDVGSKNHRITYMKRFAVNHPNKLTVLVKYGYKVRVLFFKNVGVLEIGRSYNYIDTQETDLTTWHNEAYRVIEVPKNAHGVSVSISKADDTTIQTEECTNVAIISGSVDINNAYIYLGNDGNNVGLSFCKRGVFLGDSISFGFYSYYDVDGHRCNADDLYPSDYTKTASSMRISDWFSKFYNIHIDNISERGTGYVADSRGLGNGLVKARATNFSNYDFVALCFGINDYIQAIPIGSISAKEEGTIIGNLIKILEKIYSENPYCKVVVFTPYNAWGQVRYSKGDNNTYYGDESTNYALGNPINGNTLQNIVDAINSACTYYGVESVDLSRGNFCNRINIKDILVDGLHPTEKAMKALASEMYANMTFR